MLSEKLKASMTLTTALGILSRAFLEAEATALFITAGIGTQHRPR
jgi:hypothetical protein